MINRRILLIEPPFYRLFKKTYALVRYPLSLGYLAASICEKTDWDVMAYNADFAPFSDPFDVTYFKGKGFVRYHRLLEDVLHPLWDEIREVILEYKPAVVGISAKSSTFASALRVAEIAKGVSRDIVIIAGGPHPSAIFYKMFAAVYSKSGSAGKIDELTCAPYRDIDIFAVGEGDYIIVDLLNALEQGGSLDRVRGIVCKKGEKLAAASPGIHVKNLDVLPFPFCYASRVLKDYDIYPTSAFSNLFATRGCPYNCLFCGSRNIWGRSVRFRSPQNVAEEMIYLKNAGIQHFHFDDDTFGVTGDYLKALCGTITETCRGIGWSCEMHVRLVNDENLSRMKNAGCTMVQLGIESGNNDLLREIRKGFTINDALAACRLIKAYGIKLQTFFMAGFPQETEESLNDTARLIEEIECDKIIYSIFTPYPGTEAFDLCRNMGMIPDRYNPSLCYHQSPENCFCINLAPERFRELSSRIEGTVVQKNSAVRSCSG